MRTIDVIWFIILIVWGYSIFGNIQWLGYIVMPLVIGLFIVFTSGKQVEDANTFYANWSRRLPFLFPSSWVEKTSYGAQYWITVIVGVAFVLFALYNFLISVNIIK